MEIWIRRNYFFISVIILFFVSDSFGVDAGDVVKKADLWRAPASSFEALMKVTSFRDNQKVEELELRSYVRDINSVMVEFTGPASWRGRRMLMLGNEMWMIFPNTSKPIRITPAQRLMGEVANGDIAKINLSEDYRANFKGEVNINGDECYLLELVAKETDGVTYYRINYLVRKEDYRPVKAEFFSLSGRKLKEAYYSDVKEMGGGMRISKITIYDSISTNRYSVMNYLDMILRDIPSRYFNLDFLIKK
ncbi:MAG: outer membrane lipoprotein-sorting protein [Brevinematales bacterium]|nr:outer membrane lipoprotein-sorting protein [Brevinematales bacterium]